MKADEQGGFFCWGEIILQTKDLTKKYQNKVVVDNLNIQIKEGEIFGLLGPNGAGKD